MSLHSPLLCSVATSDAVFPTLWATVRVRLQKCYTVKFNQMIMIVVKEDGIILPCSIHTCLGVVRDHFYVKLGLE